MNKDVWKPTHAIKDYSQEKTELVMHVDGAAYTELEWNLQDNADYETDGEGNWTFQGRGFYGVVYTLK